MRGSCIAIGLAAMLAAAPSAAQEAAKGDGLGRSSSGTSGTPAQDSTDKGDGRTRTQGDGPATQDSGGKGSGLGRTPDATSTASSQGTGGKGDGLGRTSAGTNEAAAQDNGGKGDGLGRAKEVSSQATGAKDGGALGQFDLPFESESSLGGKFDLKFEVYGTTGGAARQFKVRGTLTNTDISPQYNGTFDGTMSMSDTRTVNLAYDQPGANAHGTVVFRFSPDGETIAGDGVHMGTTPFKWTGRRKR